MTASPDALGERVTTLLAEEHGEGWRDRVRVCGAAWRRLADERIRSPDEDLYGGRLTALGVPSLFVHGGRDPRTEPGELDALRAAVARPPANGAPSVEARFAVLAEGGHSPHSERATADEVTRIAAAFLREAQA